jgi:hypothetical protein
MPQSTERGSESLRVGLVMSCGSEVIAPHSRSYGREEMIFNPLHYLALLE